MEVKTKLKKLEELAKQGKWETIDNTLIPELCKIRDQGIIEWAKQNLHNEDENVRDVAASLLEKYSIPEKSLPEIRKELSIIMQDDTNPFAQYRAAFALAKHGPVKYKAQVIAKLKEAEEDKDVGKIAEKYLKKLSK